ncbi:uncharacterized protein FA14DRAFT_159408 [Meira miltonrushii]|uniref:Uncharacterized protein n=1 Tax=Meira miltonrushii TaxID=1280837 RepID=A0A316VI02_9BASI|nr:uncharacterized protein FA14DRAFT_159408 [Meira miltonrushii]PWN37287.1 hypothetical protein FA14DRAFT_159408 [Meira miltonrushii]
MATIQNGKKHVLGRVASQPTLQSFNSPPNLSQDPMPASPGIATFASSFARDLKSKASIVFSNDNQQQRSRQHRPSISSTFEKSSASSEGLGTLSQSTSALTFNSSGTRVDGTIRKMMRNTSTHLSGLGIRPGKVRERTGRAEYRYDNELPKSASYISSFYSSTDSLQMTHSAKDGQFPTFDDRARWEAMCDAQNRSSNSPLTIDFDVLNKPLPDIVGANDVFGKGIYQFPSPMYEIGMTHHEDSQEMLDRTTESYDMYSKHKFGYRPKNEMARSWSADKVKEVPLVSAQIKLPHKRHLTAEECAEAIFRGAEEGFQWQGEDGQPCSLRGMLLAYGEALSRERKEKKEEKVNDAHMQLCALTFDSQRTDTCDRLDERDVLDLTGMGSPIDATEDTNMSSASQFNEGLMGESLTHSASSTTESALSCDTIKKDSNLDSRPSYAFLNEPAKGNEIYFSPPRPRTSSLKHRRSNQYTPMAYKGTAKMAAGQREENRRPSVTARDSGGSSSNASMASYTAAF